MAGQRTLTPSIVVRIHGPQPTPKGLCTSPFAVSGSRGFSFGSGCCAALLCRLRRLFNCAQPHRLVPSQHRKGSARALSPFLGPVDSRLVQAAAQLCCAAFGGCSIVLSRTGWSPANKKEGPPLRPFFLVGSFQLPAISYQRKTTGDRRQATGDSQRVSRTRFACGAFVSH
jgi:hypothetical protein